MKTIIFFSCLFISFNLFSQKKIVVNTAHQLSVAMAGGSFVGTSDKNAKIRITEFSNYLRIKNYYNNSELKITKQAKREITSATEKGIFYLGDFQGNSATITMVLKGDKVRATVKIGELNMVIIGEIESVL